MCGGLRLGGIHPLIAAVFFHEGGLGFADVGGGDRAVGAAVSRAIGIEPRVQFQPALVRLGDGEGERILTESYLDEGPEWSPNGRVITFFRETSPGAGPKLWSVDLTGRNLRQIPTPTDASDPAWSPLLN